MKPEVIEFIKWQIGVGIAFFSLVVAWMAIQDRRRSKREEEIAEALREREEQREHALRERIESKDRLDQERWQRTDNEIRALQLQMRALELELARNFMPREGVEGLIQRFSEDLAARINEVKNGLSSLTHRLLEQYPPHDPPRRR